MSLTPVMVNILGLKINAIDNGATVQMGTAQQIDFFVSYKRNQGIGEQNGDLSPMSFTLSWVRDQELIDSPTWKISLL
ncbi:hypothetical protein [Cohnella caldifontis]|uniref:hypothetical protein n=1 Tax=Cohnella caldifontis TaxID=3027471 RepID=UPI0023ED175C|nr:hypothetical protein [Cohnella sp. YIM B05605]